MNKKNLMSKGAGAWIYKTAVGGAESVDLYGSDNVIDPSIEFFSYLRHGEGLLNLIAQKARWAPFNTRAAIPTSAITSDVVAENAAAAVSGYGMTFSSLEPTKAGGVIVVSNEAIRADSRTIKQAWADLRNAVTLATDAKTLAICKAAVTPASGGATPLDDIKTLLTGVSKSGVGDLVLVVSPARAATLCTISGTGGNLLFPDCGPTGGIICGVSTIVTAGQKNDEMTLIDCTGLLVNDKSAEVLQARDAMVEMDSAPVGDSQTPTGATTSMVSMFQSDCTAFRGTRHFGVKPVRTSSVAVITGISW